MAEPPEKAELRPCPQWGLCYLDWWSSFPRGEQPSPCCTGFQEGGPWQAGHYLSPAIVQHSWLDCL